MRDNSVVDLAARHSAFEIPANWTFEHRGIAAGFERHVREQLPWYDLATGAVAHVARHYIPKNGVVYDLGAATGNIGRALGPTIADRKATLISVEPSKEMAACYDGPQRENLRIERAEDAAYEPFDLAVAFLTLMFVEPAERPLLVQRLVRTVRLGGALVVLDKCEPVGGYPATVLARLALAGKLATGVEPAEILAKELSLCGVQRPVAENLIPARAVEFFRFGEFAGWIIEAPT
jgi:tRNA (cmo5U34)-methyltransferase